MGFASGSPHSTVNRPIFELALWKSVLFIYRYPQAEYSRLLNQSIKAALFLPIAFKAQIEYLADSDLLKTNKAQSPTMAR